MKKFLIILLGVFGILLFPNIVNAAGVKVASVTDDQGVRELSLTLELANEEEISSVAYKCDINNGDLELKVNPNKTVSFETIDGMYTYTSDLENGLVIGNLEVTNPNEKEASFKINCAVKIDGEDYNITKTDWSVKAKKVEKETYDDARLKSVEISQGTMNIPFDKDTFDYVIYGIADTINSMRFTVECNLGECSWDITGGKSSTNRTVTLNQGANNVQISVTSSDYTNTLTYNFVVYRGETTYNSSKLSNLSIDKYKLSPAFSKDVLEYNITVPNKVNGINSILSYKAEDSDAKVEVKGVDNFQEGPNELTLTVTSVLGDVKTYKIIINRLSASAIEVTRYFNDQVTYKDAEGKELSLGISEFETLYSDEYKKIATGVYKFDKDGYVTVPQDDPVDEPNQEEEEKPTKKGDKRLILIVIVLGALLIIIIAACLLFRKKKPADQVSSEDDDEILIPKEKEIKENEREDVSLGEGFKGDESVSIDAALTDLMSTKQYDFDDLESKDKDEK